LIEAAMIAKNIAPGARRTFDFQQFNNYDADLRKGLMHQAKEKIFHGQYQLFGTDIDEKVLTYAKANANRAGVADCISFSC
jgi:putative N6-adenine-specific DNA methylase